MIQLPPANTDGLKGAVLRHLTALLIIWSLLLFLFLALLAPFTQYLSDSAEGIVVGGFVSIITLIVNSLYQGEATKQAARSAQLSHDAGVAAGMATPSAVTTTTTTAEGATTVTEPPITTEEFPQ